MATRFGGRSVRDNYVVKLRWVVGCLLTLIAFLGGSIVYLAFEDQARAHAVVESASNSSIQIVPDFVELLVAGERIEQNQPFSLEKVTVKQFPAQQAPPSALLAAQLHTLQGKFATRMIPPGFPIDAEDFTDRRPFSQLPIPDGYRAITLDTDQREIVDGYATPGSRVDLLFTYTDKGTRKLATIVRFAKIAAIDGIATPTGERQPVAGKVSRVTLSVTEEEARIIELARSEGRISFVLHGATAMPTYQAGERDPDPLSLAQILGAEPPKQTVVADGIMSFSDPYTGELVTYELVRGQWRRRDVDI